MFKKTLFFNIILQLLYFYNKVYTYNSFLTLINRREVIYLTSAYLLNKKNNTKIQKPICIIGANGETGRECVKLLANQHQYVKAVSRKFNNINQFNDINQISKQYIETKKIDIKNDISSLNDVIKDSSSVIFLANAKKYNRYIKTDIEEFQNYEDIDIYGLKNVINKCIQHRIPRLVYVSASCKSCNEGLGDIDKISGLKCDNCQSKQIGEKLIKKYYKEANLTNVNYTIIRIGYLIDGTNRDVSEIEINQDYTKSGMISKIDLANLCINTVKNNNTADTTFEAYYRDTTQPYDVKESLKKCTNLGKSVEECFFGSSFKNRKPANLDEARKTPIKGSLFTTGFEHNGNTWNELFKNLKKDIDIIDQNNDDNIFDNIDSNNINTT